ncbi:sugar phosphate isomerase/epimerase family protein [Veronia nyctiphanis]|uniref:sugar phosphate isomerase/epimerase family protein n=1 Tax=Veronia nyctiphanis TaxID=1278244 RepID=UPI00191C6EE2|nr:TIM barrel protein [Veronia nyctiphanis]
MHGEISKMRIKFVRGMWGMAEHSLQANLKKIKEAGFHGVEGPAPFGENDKHQMKCLLEGYDLDFIGHQHSDLFRDGASVSDHISLSKQQLDNNKELGAVFVNSQTGKDYFSVEDNAHIIREVDAYATSIGLNVVHEVHRGRFSFSIASTLALLDAVPEIRLNADFSHWCCVHESLLHNQLDGVNRAIQHSDYIHARVGHPQGPQVNDPRCPHNKSALDAHLAWWDAIVERNKNDGKNEFYISPEFGPEATCQHFP